PLSVVLDAVHARRRPKESELNDVHPGEAELVAEPLDRGRDHAEVLGDEREITEFHTRGVERPAPGAAPPPSLLRRRRASADSPVGDEPAEVVKAAEIDELERTTETLRPPAVAGVAQRRPVVERVSPELPVF